MSSRAVKRDLRTHRFNALLQRLFCLSVRLSVRLSATFVSHAYVVQRIEIHFTPCDISMFLVSSFLRSNFIILSLGVDTEQVC